MPHSVLKIKLLLRLLNSAVSGTYSGWLLPRRKLNFFFLFCLYWDFWGTQELSEQRGVIIQQGRSEDREVPGSCPQPRGDREHCSGPGVGGSRKSGLGEGKE